MQISSQELAIYIIAALFIGLIISFIMIKLTMPKIQSGISTDQLNLLLQQNEILKQSINSQLSKGFKDNTDLATKLHERLASIDTAQRNLEILSNQVSDFKSIFTNKKARGTFGEVQMEELIKDILPPNTYEFQATLSNNNRVDALIKLPNNMGILCVDSKFPLENYNGLMEAIKSNNEHEYAIKKSLFRESVLKHIKDISSKYIINGETSNYAFMFLPSEAIFAEIHSNFPDIINHSISKSVAIVSPSTLMGVLNTIKAIFKDHHMMEQTKLIQKELGLLIDDVNRIDERVEKLRSHFSLASKDIEDITTSKDKIKKKIETIENMEIENTSNNKDDLKKLI